MSKAAEVFPIFRTWRKGGILNRTNQKGLRNDRELHQQYERVYGIPDALSKEGMHCGKNRVALITCYKGIVGFGKRKYKVTIYSSHQRSVYTNLVQQRFEPEHPNQSGITYMWTKGVGCI